MSDFDKKSIKDREFSKFNETSGGKTAVNVIPLNSGSIIEGISYDYLFVDRPDNVTEVYTYYNGGAEGALVATVTVTYYDTGKKKIKSVSRS